MSDDPRIEAAAKVLCKFDGEDTWAMVCEMGDAPGYRADAAAILAAADAVDPLRAQG